MAQDMRLPAPIRLHNDLVERGGGTYHADTLTPVTVESDDEWWCVGLTGGVVGTRRNNLAALARQVRGTTGYVGTWEEGGVVYVDPVALVSNLADAIALAEEHDQLAIYGLHNGETINVKLGV